MFDTKPRVLCGGCGRILSDGPIPNRHFHVASRCDSCDPTHKHEAEEHFILWKPGQELGECVFCHNKLTRAYRTIGQ